MGRNHSATPLKPNVRSGAELLSILAVEGNEHSSSLYPSLFHNFLVIVGSLVESVVSVLVYISGLLALHESLGEGDSVSRVDSQFSVWRWPGLFGLLLPRPDQKRLLRLLLSFFFFPNEAQNRFARLILWEWWFWLVNPTTAETSTTRKVLGLLVPMNVPNTSFEK